MADYSTRNIIDFAEQDSASEFRNALYASIHDRVSAHIEAKKQEIAQSLIVSNEPEEEIEDSEEINSEEELSVEEEIQSESSPFDWKGKPSELGKRMRKPGETAGFDSKKISTGTVYTRKPVKDTEKDSK